MRVPPLLGRGREWIKAPISGTAIILAHLMCIFHWLWTAEWERGALWALLAAVWTLQRDRYLELEE